MEIADHAKYCEYIVTQNDFSKTVDCEHALYEASSGQLLDKINKTKNVVTVIIDRRQFFRECFSHGLRELRLNGAVESFASVKDWLEHRPLADDDTLVLLSAADASPTVLKEDWSHIVTKVGSSVPVVLLAEEERAAYIIDAIKDGVRGYIPTSLPLSVAVEAIELVRAGGTFIPATSFLTGSTVSSHPGDAPGRTAFTGRQAEVVAALRKGTSNKVIAYNLQMAESTVKVHVRDIMRKMKARNRTHVAFLLTQQDSARW